MACGDYQTYTEFLRNGQFFDGVYCPFADTIGGALFGLLFFGAIGLALYVYTDSVAVPLVVSVLIGAVVLYQVPAIAANMVGIAIILGIAIAGFVLVMRLKPR